MRYIQIVSDFVVKTRIEGEGIMQLMRMLGENLLASRYNNTLTGILEKLQHDPSTLMMFQQFYPNIWQDLAHCGFQCIELGQFQQAFKVFEFVLQHEPSTASYHAAKADAAYALKNYTEAVKSYAKATEISPDVPDAFFYIAEICMILKSPDQAVKQLEKALSLIGDTEHRLCDKIQRNLVFAKEAMLSV